MPTIVHIIDSTGPGGAETVFLDPFHAFNRNGSRSVVLVGDGSALGAMLQDYPGCQDLYAEVLGA